MGTGCATLYIQHVFQSTQHWGFCCFCWSLEDMVPKSTTGQQKQPTVGKNITSMTPRAQSSPCPSSLRQIFPKNTSSPQLINFKTFLRRKFYITKLKKSWPNVAELERFRWKGPEIQYKMNLWTDRWIRLTDVAQSTMAFGGLHWPLGKEIKNREAEKWFSGVFLWIVELPKPRIQLVRINSCFFFFLIRGI